MFICNQNIVICVDFHVFNGQEVSRECCGIYNVHKCDLILVNAVNNDVTLVLECCIFGNGGWEQEGILVCSIEKGNTVYVGCRRYRRDWRSSQIRKELVQFMGHFQRRLRYFLLPWSSRYTSCSLRWPCFIQASWLADTLYFHHRLLWLLGRTVYCRWWKGNQRQFHWSQSGGLPGDPNLHHSGQAICRNPPFLRWYSYVH